MKTYEYVIIENESKMSIDEYAKWLALRQALTLITEQAKNEKEIQYKVSPIRNYIDAKWEELKWDLIEKYESSDFEVVSVLRLE